MDNNGNTFISGLQDKNSPSSMALIDDPSRMSLADTCKDNHITYCKCRLILYVEASMSACALACKRHIHTTHTHADICLCRYIMYTRHHI